MPDPTESVIIATFCTALGLFTVTATARKLFWKTAKPAVLPPPLPAWEVNNAGVAYYESPAFYEPVQAPLEKGIPTGFYRVWDLLGIGFVFLVFFGLVVLSLRMGEKSEKALDAGALVASIAFQYVSAGIVTAFVAARITPAKWLGLRWKGWVWILLIAPAAVVCMWIVFGCLYFFGFMDWIQSMGVETVQDTVQLLQQSKDPSVLVLMSFAAIVAAPMCEEIVFRGYLYPAAKSFTGPWVAGVCSALVFAAAHGSLAALLPLFLFGCLLVAIYEMTGSIWAPMGVHFCFNGVTVLVQMAERLNHAVSTQ